MACEGDGQRAVTAGEAAHSPVNHNPHSVRAIIEGPQARERDRL
jgi:hypothetical protein